MFDVHCPGHGKRILLFASDIQNIRNTQEGIYLHYRCFCGYEGIWHTGRTKSEGGERCEKTCFRGLSGDVEEREPVLDGAAMLTLCELQ
ncbi:hypothetical protein BH23ACT11_BH23ACT11_31320 [soil metagenome]